MQSADKPVQKKDVVRQDLDAEAVLYHSSTGKIHILNKTAERIWDLCDGNHTRQDMEAELRSSFRIPTETTIAQDIEETLNQFVSNDLISDSSE